MVSLMWGPAAIQRVVNPSPCHRRTLVARGGVGKPFVRAVPVAPRETAVRWARVLRYAVTRLHRCALAPITAFFDPPALECRHPGTKWHRVYQLATA